MTLPSSNSDEDLKLKEALGIDVKEELQDRRFNRMVQRISESREWTILVKKAKQDEL